MFSLDLLKTLPIQPYNFIYDIDKSYSNYLYDSLYKRYILDCVSFFASNPLGYNHPRLNDKEFEQTLLRVAKIKPTNGDIITEELLHFVKTFNSIAKPGDFKYSFFIESGTLAVENALKTAFDWKMNLTNNRYDPEDLDIIYFDRAFHGRSGYCLSLSNSSTNVYKNFPRFSWTKFTIDDLSSTVDCIKLYLKGNHKRVAAIILEPILGAGGDVHFTTEFFKFLREITYKYNILLIVDEVQTGVGLTGKFWAYMHHQIVPDIVCFGKKMQVCGLICTDRIDISKKNVFAEPSRIDSTWMGNLTDMVRVTKVLQVIEDEGLVDQASIVGEYLKQRLRELSSKFPDSIMCVRGRGLMCAFDMRTKKQRDKLIEKSLENNLLLFGSMGSTIRLRPSLTFTMEDVDSVYTILNLVLSTLY